VGLCGMGGLIFYFVVTFPARPVRRVWSSFVWLTKEDKTRSKVKISLIS
jgi:hypothetical protein